MAHEGMVHALTEVHRVLTPQGWLVDLRPDRRTAMGKRWRGLPRVYCLSTHGGGTLAGFLQKENLADHRAADRAAREVLRRELFTVQSAETFPFRFYFHTLSHLEDHLSTWWTNTTLPALTRRRLRLLMGRYPASQVMVIDTMRLDVMRKR